MGGYKHKQLMGKSYDEIQKLFDKEMKRVNTFVAMSSEAQESNEKKIEGSEEQAKSSRKKSLGKKRAVKKHQQKSPKRQKLEDDKETDEHEEVEADDTAELKKHLVIKKDDDIAIDAIPLATKPPMIVEYKLLKEGIMVHYSLIRADGSSKRYFSMIRMLQDIDREDLETLWKLVKTKYGDTRPEDEHERVLLGDFKVMFEPDIRSGEILRVQGERTQGVVKTLMNTKVDEPKLSDISIVRDFVDVFPENLSGLPPQRQVEFRIDLAPGAIPVAKSPYCLTPSEMQELSGQL
ncbi:hypothetical protein Tco_0511687 [Tanacetum coccineum]